MRNIFMFLTYSKGAFFLRGNAVKISEVMYKMTDLTGWKHDKHNGWFTTFVTSACLLRDHADERTKNIINKYFITHSPWKKALVIPKGLKLLPHQPGAIKYALARNRSYLGLDPGLGKTPCAALIIQAMNLPAVSIVPAGLALNTLEEYEKWNPNMSVGILGKNDWIVPQVLIVPDSILNREDTRRYLRFFNPKVITIDEVHRYKESTAGRTKALFGYTDRRKVNPIVPGIVDARELQKLVVMSGTPMPNRPIELFPMLKKLSPEYINFEDKDSFGMKFCSGKWNGHGYDYSGTNIKAVTELRNKFVSVDDADPNGFMLRLKKDILKLPPLTEELVILGDEMTPTLYNADMAMLKKYSPEDIMKRSLKKGDDELHLSTYRRLLGMHKVKPSAAYIKDILENTDEKLLLFGVHIDVMKELEDLLGKYDPLFISGKTNKVTKHNMVTEFQKNKHKRIFGGNIDAAGLGITLTKANRVILVEWSWVQTTNRQAIDRSHRYGLTHPLLAQYLAFRNSLDRAIYEVNNNKKRITALV